MLIGGMPQAVDEYIKTNAKSLVQGIAFDSQYGGRGEYSICTKGSGHVSIDENGTRTFKIADTHSAKPKRPEEPVQQLR